MTIRTRLALWYTGILFVGLSLVGGWAYYEMVIEHPGVTRVLAGEGHTPVQEFGEVVLYGGLPALVLALVGGWFLMRSALRPVTELTRAVERIHADNLSERLPRSGNGDELDRLTEMFNSMMARLEGSFLRVREFTLHASHELKTPLTVIRSELETALNEESISAPERERSVSLLDEVERLTHIVDSLTFLTKADAGQVKMNRATLALDDLVREAMENAQALAQSKQIEIRLKDCNPVSVVGDRRRLRQLLLILTDNAIKYNVPEGHVTLALGRENGTAILSVANTGPGIPPGLMDRVFDRFFRCDVAHSHEVDGCGLGLTIARWIVQAHNGKIQIMSEPNRNTTVTVRLPGFAQIVEAKVPARPQIESHV